MAQLFIENRSENSTNPSWSCVALDGDAVALDVHDDRLHVECVDAPNAPLLLVRAAAEGGTAWVALARGDVALNGCPLRTRVAVLDDRDELRIGTESVSAFVSLERQPTLERYEGDDASTCPRCKTEIERGHWTVVCPSPDCGVRHHQDEDEGLPCWLDVERCALCSQPTPFDAETTFTPGEL